MAGFSLLDEGWIPVRPLEGGAVRFVGLHEALMQARTFERIDDPSPLVTVALYRLCLAVLHRALRGPKDAAQAAEWYSSSFPYEAIQAYLDTHADRFDLFHETQPFMQVADLTPELDGGKYLSHWTRLGTEVGSANTTALFNPAGRPGGERNDAISPAEAARRLLEHQTFALEGLIRRFAFRAEDAPVAESALTLPQGRTLHETLCLNLVPYVAGDDAPAWEQPPLSAGTVQKLYEGGADLSCVVRGLTDHYSWVSRSVRLIPEEDATVRFIGFAAGIPFKNTLEETGKTVDPMVATVPSRNPKKPLPFPQKLRREQLFWRDVLALLPEPQNQREVVEKGKAAGQVIRVKGTPPASVYHAREVLRALEEQGRSSGIGGSFDLDALDDASASRYAYAQPVIPVSVFGQLISKDGTKVYSYRQEGYTLPHAFVEDPQRFTDEVFTALEAAKHAGGGLKQAIRRLVTETLARGGEREPHKDDVNRLMDQLPAEATFWARLEAPFRQYLAALDDSPTEAAAEWRRTLTRTAWNAWAFACQGVGEGAAALRAASLAGGLLASALKDLAPPPEEPRDRVPTAP
ncbi:type I-E CRISPR-associated protein Cse1/CasA [Deinococcus arcticus]|uniref:Type I-E CRISPR-associated protein Cse1/CasA n=1 Tax=Deinococcus arcticus TaxID=2136176 RepID=A0A2T3W9C0_9DEIO|nr:type I-E CRISPR-associated protein Cse1/CasA [Deinococcus arcticus]PTA68499.1 type I-E CRISPR-associated protein Cse1/CasA [Deinococcus arcticus]